MNFFNWLNFFRWIEPDPEQSRVEQSRDSYLERHPPSNPADQQVVHDWNEGNIDPKNWRSAERQVDEIARNQGWDEDD